MKTYLFFFFLLFCLFFVFFHTFIKKFFTLFSKLTSVETISYSDASKFLQRNHIEFSECLQNYSEKNKKTNTHFYSLKLCNRHLLAIISKRCLNSSLESFYIFENFCVHRLLRSQGIGTYFLKTYFLFLEKTDKFIFTKNLLFSVKYEARLTDRIQQILNPFSLRTVLYVMACLIPCGILDFQSLKKETNVPLFIFNIPFKKSPVLFGGVHKLDHFLSSLEEKCLQNIKEKVQQDRFEQESQLNQESEFKQNFEFKRESQFYTLHLLFSLTMKDRNILNMIKNTYNEIYFFLDEILYSVENKLSDEDLLKIVLQHLPEIMLGIQL